MGGAVSAEPIVKKPGSTRFGGTGRHAADAKDADIKDAEVSRAAATVARTLKMTPKELMNPSFDFWRSGGIATDRPWSLPQRARLLLICGMDDCQQSSMRIYGQPLHRVKPRRSRSPGRPSLGARRAVRISSNWQ
ncbi:hypothetical protein [Bosea sp. LjRoot9]|uniref:hypothetical protein n=1 Tax=Bosea sp. LjRoot9 TaxID=3342341 RepID=UPI003F5056F4